ncbi:hypothetical protein DOY81_008851 [Sarcophaga bullata]|nr:hypothetical protein DOY81_008851 [Sarcophaga bullata]
MGTLSNQIRLAMGGRKDGKNGNIDIFNVAQEYPTQKFLYSSVFYIFCFCCVNSCLKNFIFLNVNKIKHLLSSAANKKS